MVYQKKINLSKQTNIPHHNNGGWNFVLKVLHQFHTNDGIFLDDLADITFGNNYENNSNQFLIPYKQHWIGFFHHPVNIAPWYIKSFQLKPDFMICTDEFIQSKFKCLGLFTFSKCMVSWYQKHLPDIRIEHLWHPTQIPEIQFNLNSFLLNPRPNILQIGFFLRKLTSIFFLNTSEYNKIILLNPFIYDNLYREMNYYKYNLEFENLRFMSYINSKEYDILLSKNIVFLDLFDSCANNIILECIVRNTPILVKKIDSVIEYLGEKYPFYFDTIEEASKKLADKKLIIETHHYLSDNPIKKFLTEKYFVDSFYNSEIYSKL